MGRSASFVGEVGKKKTGPKIQRGIFQRLKLAESYMTLKAIGTKGHLSHEKNRWQYKEVLHPLGINSVAKQDGHSFNA